MRAPASLRLQVPLVSISQAIETRTRGTTFEALGNYLFWCCFCFIGQPGCVLAYYYMLAPEPPPPPSAPADHALAARLVAWWANRR